MSLVNPATPSLAVGTHALQYATGVDNMAVGHAALGALTTGTYNTALGINAAALATTVNQITAVGYAAGGTSPAGGTQRSGTWRCWA